jgi:uncharacterized protein with HEPN domain
MTEQSLKYLYDILQSIELIEEFTIDICSFDAYVNDLKTHSAVERQLGIIGEVVNKFHALQSEVILSNSSKIKGFRNRLIYAYDAVDPSIV